MILACYGNTPIASYLQLPAVTKVTTVPTVTKVTTVPYVKNIWMCFHLTLCLNNSLRQTFILAEFSSVDLYLQMTLSL